MPNENCLLDIACPKCHQTDRFLITATATFDVTDDGTEAVGDVEWDDHSIIKCPECGHRDTVIGFGTLCYNEDCGRRHDPEDSRSLSDVHTGVIGLHHTEEKCTECEADGTLSCPDGAFICQRCFELKGAVKTVADKLETGMDGHSGDSV